MKMDGGIGLSASYATIAVAGVAGMVALLHLANVDTSKSRLQVAVGQRVATLPPAVDRMAFAPADAFREPPALRPSITSDADVASSEASEDDEDPTDETASWTTETVTAPWETDSHAARVEKASRPAEEDTSAPARKGRPHYSRDIEKRLAQISPRATARLMKKFEAAKLSWPPSEIALIGIKDEKVLELHAKSKGGPWGLVYRYRVLAASGHSGPKLRQGDRQVPEGIYRIAWLNPNSSYHVSLRVSYPNAFDRKMAAKEGRKDLGGDIMIHGKNLSAGCLAIGDEAVEEVFTVAAETGLRKIRVIIAPTDFRMKPTPDPAKGQPEWLPKLYTEIASAMSGYETATPIATGSTNMASSFMSFFAK